MIERAKAQTAYRPVQPHIAGLQENGERRLLRIRRLVDKVFISLTQIQVL